MLHLQKNIPRQSSLACFYQLFLSIFLSCLNVQSAQPLPEWEYNGNAEQLGYRVQYSRAGSQGRALTHVIADRLEREFTIEDLEEWTEYEVRVQAVNGIGMGPWSQPVRGRTRESGECAPHRSSSVKNTVCMHLCESSDPRANFCMTLLELLKRSIVCSVSQRHINTPFFSSVACDKYD